MKRIAKILVLAFVLPVILSGCGEDNSESTLSNGTESSYYNEDTTREPLPDYLEEKLNDELKSIMEEAERKQNEADEARKQDYEYLEGISSEIIRCLDEKDSESLKAMFSVSTQNNFELDKEIETLFKNYEGKATDYFLTNTSWTGGVRDGEFVDKHFAYEIRNICTDSGNTYCITLCVYQIYVYDQDRLGLISISLLDGERNYITSVGGWAD